MKRYLAVIILFAVLYHANAQNDKPTIIGGLIIPKNSYVYNLYGLILSPERFQSLKIDDKTQVKSVEREKRYWYDSLNCNRLTYDEVIVIKFKADIELNGSLIKSEKDRYRLLSGIKEDKINTMMNDRTTSKSGTIRIVLK